jgi:hypothetical protein
MPFPVPWYLIPLNIAFGITFIGFIIFSSSRKKLDATRNAAGIPGSIFGEMNDGARAIIHASLPEIEYPHLLLEGTVCAGPIFEHVPPIDEVSWPELTRFLDKGKTVLVNLGSIFKYSEKEVEAMAQALVVARERMKDRGGFQALWKLPKAGTFKGVLDKVLGEERGDILVQEWIDPPALALLQHPNLVVHVHHGGASKSLLTLQSISG